MKTVPVCIYSGGFKINHKVGELTLNSVIMETLSEMLKSNCRVELGGSMKLNDDGILELSEVELLSKPKLPDNIG